jgi:hypothetical protein
MKSSICLLALLALAGCAAARAPAVTAQPLPSRVATPSVPADPVAALARFGQSDSLSPLQAVALLGPPDVDRRDGVGALLTWRLESCAVVLGFAADRLISSSFAPRQAGGTAPSAAECVFEAQSRAKRP